MTPKSSSDHALIQLLEAPDTVAKIRALSERQFAELVRSVGVADAGELIALASTAQLIEAFDEDLFSNDAPGEREAFNASRFIAWLEVLLEAGDDVCADRFSELSEDFIAHALSHLIVVIDFDRMRGRISDHDPATFRFQKALQSAHTEELDGYLVVALQQTGWNAVWSLILALDAGHRDLLVRILDRLTALAEDDLDELDHLAGILTSAQSLAEDAESEREDRRLSLGFVEPRAARAFRQSSREGAHSLGERDPITRRYFRHVSVPDAPRAQPDRDELATVAAIHPFDAVMEGMRQLARSHPEVYVARLSELAYLSNVLASAGILDGARLRPVEASQAAVATVAAGVRELVGAPTFSASQAAATLRQVAADQLFRRGARTSEVGFVASRADLSA